MNREKYIQDKLWEHYDEAEALGKEIFAIILQGSQNYKLDFYSDEYQSDVDTKAIVLPSFDDFCRGASPLSTTHERQNKEHIDLKDIRVMFETFKKQNVNFVEVLFSDYYIVNPKYGTQWTALQELGEELTHCHPSQTLKTMAGMSCEKRKALCHPYPTIKDKIDKYGYDGKQLHHIIRINEFMKNYIKGMSFKQCLTERRPQVYIDMMMAKLNRYDLETAVAMADKYDAENCRLKDEFIEKYGQGCDSRPYEKLSQIKVDILKQWFKEQLCHY